MDEEVKVVFKLSGSVFTLVAALLFYNHLFTAAGNPGFFTVVYFNFFGEGIFELILFTAFIPFILYSFVMEIRKVQQWKKN